MSSADGRYAPSPSGTLHLGNLRTALLAWLFARSQGGRFVLRIEDLDGARSREQHALGAISALGLSGSTGTGSRWRRARASRVTVRGEPQLSRRRP